VSSSLLYSGSKTLRSSIDEELGLWDDVGTGLE